MAITKCEQEYVSCQCCYSANLKHTKLQEAQSKHKKLCNENNVD